MSRLALRYYLPLVQVVLFLGLLVVGQYESYEAAHRNLQEVGWSLPSYERPNFLAETFRFLNAPALTVLFPLLLILLSEPEWVLLLVAALAILLFWFGVGRFFDRLRVLIPSRPLYQRGKAWRLACQLLLLIAALGFGCGIFLLKSDSFPEGVLAYPLIVWSGLGGLILISEMRQPRVQEELTLVTLKR